MKKKNLRQTNYELVCNYPFLMPRNVLTDKIDKNYRYDWTLADKISHGWRKAFGRQLFEELKEELVRWDYLYDFRFIQIKEKYGSLRLYSNGIPDGSNILEILDKYESLSETICERCEKLKQMIINYRGWYQCICKFCLIQNENRLLKMPALKKQLFINFLPNYKKRLKLFYSAF